MVAARDGWTASAAEADGPSSRAISRDAAAEAGSLAAAAAPSRARWADAAGYTISTCDAAPRDRHRLRRGGFRRGRGPGQLLERAVPARPRILVDPGQNALVGPFVAIISFVCSVGNVPLAAALWHDGISFGGVVAFVFADLISLPLLLIYRKIYGGRLTLRLLGVFWLVMSAAGPAHRADRQGGRLSIPAHPAAVIAPEHLSWNYTTILNIIFLVALAAIYWLHRSKDASAAARR